MSAFALRHIEAYALGRVLGATLKVDDLSRLHEEPKLQSKMLLVRNQCTMFEFQKAYDAFVTSFCVPLIHSIAMSTNISTLSLRNPRFAIAIKHSQIRILRPGESSKDLSETPQRAKHWLSSISRPTNPFLWHQCSLFNFPR